jgi:hypothetical protein
MPNSLTFDETLPGDPSGRALAIGLWQDEIDKVLRPGLKAVQDTMPTLAAKAGEILAEVGASKGLLADGLALLKIDRKVDEQLLRLGKLKVTDCDKEKILALIAALVYEGSARAHVLRQLIMESLVQGGIPLHLAGEPKLGGSLQIQILDQSLELKFVRPA